MWSVPPLNAIQCFHPFSLLSWKWYFNGSIFSPAIFNQLSVYISAAYQEPHQLRGTEEERSEEVETGKRSEMKDVGCGESNWCSRPSSGRRTPSQSSAAADGTSYDDSLELLALYLCVCFMTDWEFKFLIFKMRFHVETSDQLIKHWSSVSWSKWEDRLSPHILLWIIWLE